MKCPDCGKEMIDGVVQSARQIFFTDRPHKYWFAPDAAVNGEVLLSSHLDKANLHSVPLPKLQKGRH